MTEGTRGDTRHVRRRDQSAKGWSRVRAARELERAGLDCVSLSVPEADAIEKAMFIGAEQAAGLVATGQAAPGEPYLGLACHVAEAAHSGWPLSPVRVAPVNCRG
jgi:hypothetical protein